jgi:hypothetical protein
VPRSVERDWVWKGGQVEVCSRAKAVANESTEGVKYLS